MLLALLIGIVIMAVALSKYVFGGDMSDLIEFLTYMPLWGALVGFFLIYPLVLTVINFVGIFRMPEEGEKDKIWTLFALVTFLLGTIDSFLLLAVSDMQLNAEWTEQLYNDQMHQPIWTEGIFSVVLFCGVGIIGYLILSCIRLDKLPPLVTVLSMSGMYLGILECVLWSIQITKSYYWLLGLFPMNCVLISIRLIRRKILEWNWIHRKNEAQEEQSQNGRLGKLNAMLGKAGLWPIYAFILMWPLLGILLCILVLFGQKPDSVIKAWTETAEWRLSQKTAPPQLYYDEHYLCTVAAGGHEKLVKPIRMGERHGHRVVVNRQLCIANAFEQILEERTPRFHKAVRHFYDTYGFPIAKLIRTKGAADIVYIIMKPLEWIFLIVLYLCDANPENRIAVQYLPKHSVQ